MSINHHPNDEFLLDYSSGGLGEAWELAVATHLALCPKCRHTVAQMESIGGSLLDTLEPTTFSTASFDKVMERLDNTPVDVPPTVDRRLRKLVAAAYHNRCAATRKMLKGASSGNAWAWVPHNY